MNKKITLSLLTLILSLSACSNTKDKEPDLSNNIDVFIFMGQSNMGGRGNPDPSKWPNIVKSVKCQEGHGYEFRSVSDPTKLYPLEEPFGYSENNAGISDTKGDGGKKTGSLVSAFVEAYYEKTHVPVLAISASEGGTNSAAWGQNSSTLTKEAISRLDSALNFMYSSDEFTVRHINMVWLQGESDSGHFITEGVTDPATITTPEKYKENTLNVIKRMQTVGVEKCFLITIGNYIPEVSQDNYYRYKQGQKIQEELCRENDDVVLTSIKLQDMPTEDGVWMHDNNHYFQNGYNILGNDAGKNAAEYILSGVQPICSKFTMSDNEINVKLQNEK